MTAKGHAQQGAAVSLSRVMRVAHFRAALRAFLQQNDAHVEKAGLTPQRYLLLLMVIGAADGSGSMTITDVAERMKLSRNAVSELATRAEAAGLLTRRPGEDDARFVRLEATAEGKRRVHAVIAESDRARSELAHALGVLPEVFAATRQCSQPSPPLQVAGRPGTRICTSKSDLYSCRFC